MTQPYISGPDPVEAAGNTGRYSIGSLIPQNPIAATGTNFVFPYQSIDAVVGLDGAQFDAKEDLPTYKPMSMEKAAGYFRSNYIAKMAEYTGKTTISDLSEKAALDMNRSDLSRIINSYEGLKDYLLELDKQSINTDSRFENDIPSGILDPIARRVMRESIASGYYGLTDATERFKDIYTNSLTGELGVAKAANVLGVTERTVKNRLWNYLNDERNQLRFPDDCKPDNLEDMADAGGRIEPTATQKQASEELRIWQQQEPVRFSKN